MVCERDELWITSKLWNTYHRHEHVQAACEKSLADLGIDYFDLYLIHFPIALKYVDFNDRYPPEWIFDPEAENPGMRLDAVPLSETWGAMERTGRAWIGKEYRRVQLHERSPKRSDGLRNDKAGAITD